MLQTDLSFNLQWRAERSASMIPLIIKVYDYDVGTKILLLNIIPCGHFSFMGIKTNVIAKDFS